MELWFFFLFALILFLLAFGESPDSDKSRQLPNPTSRSSHPHSGDAREALRKADWRCQICGLIVSPASIDPLHIEELPSREYVGERERYSKFRILCTECHSKGPPFYGLRTAFGAAPKSASTRKALPASVC